MSSALEYTPWWLSASAEKLRESTDEGGGGGGGGGGGNTHGGAMGGGEACGEAAADCTEESRPVGASVPDAGSADESWCGIGSAEQEQLLQLPRKEYLMERRERRVALCGLVDILFAYCYDVRTTEDVRLREPNRATRGRLPRRQPNTKISLSAKYDSS